MDEIRVLQLGNEDWNEIYALPQGITMEYVEAFTQIPKKPYDMVFLDRAPLVEELEPLHCGTKAYTLFVTDQVKLGAKARQLFEEKKGKWIGKADVSGFLQQEARFFFPKPYGEKFRLRAIAVAQGFCGCVKWSGDCHVELLGDYGEDFRQIVYWRNNIPVSQGQMLDFWLEYEKDPEVEISLSITKLASGSISDIIGCWEFNEEDLKQIVQIDNNQSGGWIFLSLRAKGRGRLQLIALHDRHSRGKHGYFLPGGERYVTSKREEIFCYYNPGDRKPPLNVYFSGYKTRQGFEGYYMMESFGAPYLLVAEPRLEGGSFYMGSEEYELLMVNIIGRYMEELGFTSNQVIMAGLSMGTYGAMYYGCDIEPHAIILGKPLASVGNIARNLRLNRPRSFDTSLDVLRYLGGDTDQEAIQTLNDRFWKKFDAADWEHSKFAVAYMLEDDYDADAYATMLSHLDTVGVQVYGKGLRGRHNDNTNGIVSWFSSQYSKILREDFGRMKKE